MGGKGFRLSLIINLSFRNNRNKITDTLLDVRKKWLLARSYYNIRKATDEKCYLRIIIVDKDERLKLTAGQICNRILILSFVDVINTNKF